MKITWKDAYSQIDRNLEYIKKSLGSGLAIVHGDIVHEDDEWVVVRYLHYPHLEESDECIVIPKSLIVNRRTER